MLRSGGVVVEHAVLGVVWIYATGRQVLRDGGEREVCVWEGGGWTKEWRGYVEIDGVLRVVIDGGCIDEIGVVVAESIRG